MKKLNKFIVLIICVIVVSIAYFGIQKAIDSYAFTNDSEIITEDESFEGDAEEIPTEESSEENNDDNSGEFSDGETDLVIEEMETEAEVEDTIKTEEDNKIYVYITGEVNHPGVVLLNEGSRIVDAINASGGTTAKANVSKVNLVYVLDDGMKVNIPNDNDLKNNPDFEYITMNSGDGGREDYSSNSENGVSGEGASKGSLSTSSSRSYSIVNINTATQTELETLPGIGPSLALKIINYRKENGKFSSIEEIKNVSGIGESKFEDLKGYITV